MIRVTVELLPASGGKPRHLGTAVIINDGTGDVASGNYWVMLSKWGRPGEAWKRGRVEGFDRKRLGPWDLLLAALASTIGERLARQLRRRTPPLKTYCDDERHCRGKTHEHCGDQNCCWGPAGKREPCPRYSRARRRGGDTRRVGERSTGTDAMRPDMGAPLSGRAAARPRRSQRASGNGPFMC